VTEKASGPQETCHLSTEALVWKRQRKRTWETGYSRFTWKTGVEMEMVGGG